MLNFENIEDLVSHMFEKLDGDEPVSIVANKELSVSIIQELLEYNNVILKYANVDDWEYDKEYIVTLHDDLDTDSWDIAIEPIYSYENEKYLGTDGYVLFHENVNSKAMVDMQNNENIELSGHDWFVIGEEEDVECKDDETDLDQIKNTDLSTKTSTAYRVNGKAVDKDTYLKSVKDFEDKYTNIMRSNLLAYCEFMDEMHEWRKLFCW